MRKENQHYKSKVLPETDASGSILNLLAFLVLRLRQHYQFYTLVFLGKNIFLWKELLNIIKR
jgi:hypothetical protein